MDKESVLMIIIQKSLRFQKILTLKTFLRNSISNDGREIVIDQKGNFTVNGEDYSKMGLTLFS